MKELENKIKEINNKINNDDSDFLTRIYKAYTCEYTLNSTNKVLPYNSISSDENILYLLITCNENNVFNNYNESMINILKIPNEQDFDESNFTDNIKHYNKIEVIIDLKDISTYPIWNTDMRRRITSILNNIKKVDIDNISEKELNKIVHKSKMIELNENKTYNLDYLIKIMKLIQNKAESKEYEVYYISNNLTNEEIFFVNEFEKFIEVLKCEDDKFSIIYDKVCADLDKTVLIYDFCNFKNDMCISQRHKSIVNKYPYPKKDGCCFKVINKCEHNNKDGTCKVKCIACKLFTCPYLSKMGIGYRASELILIRAFLNEKQKKAVVFDFFKSKEHILSKIKKRETKV